MSYNYTRCPGEHHSSRCQSTATAPGSPSTIPPVGSVQHPVESPPKGVGPATAPLACLATNDTPADPQQL